MAVDVLMIMLTAAKRGRTAHLDGGDSIHGTGPIAISLRAQIPRRRKAEQALALRG